MWFNDFEYEVSHDPTAEELVVRFGPDLGKSCPREFWPDIETGVRVGCAELRWSGLRLCCTALTIPSAHYHDVDTTPRGVRLRVGQFVEEEIKNWVIPIDRPPDAWLTPTVLALASGIHTERAPDRLPILADALEDAGCDNSFALEHLRTCPDHGLSCWVIEWILAATR